MAIEQIIIKWKLNRSLLADKMGMPSGTFNNKMNPKHPAQFTKGELWNLREVLIEMLTDLEKATDMDFNDGLKALVS